ncbi:MAG: ABC transporter [Alphaproteobacteria bacterium]|nr:ABC transporter [Alphaproteobacteria bacterium]
MNNLVIKVSNLIKFFDEKKIINNISFNVTENSIVGILGKNGAGKTTLLGMLMGLISQSSGEIEIFGKNLNNYKNEILKNINFQSPYVDLPKKMTVEQNLFFYSRLYGIKKIKDTIEDLVCQLKMNDLMGKNYGSLSAGQKTKVNLCKALLNSPKLLLLDEPTASLDPETSIFIREFLIKYQKKNSSSILITSHNLEEIQSICSQIILLKFGTIASNGNLKDLLKFNNYSSLQDFFLGKG